MGIRWLESWCMRGDGWCSRGNAHRQVSADVGGVDVNVQDGLHLPQQALHAAHIAQHAVRHIKHAARKILRAQVRLL
jgi:hypothetical protein